MTTKSIKRTALIDSLANELIDHELFSDNVKRDRDTEKQIQKSLFLRMEKTGLQKVLTENLDMKSNKIKEVIKKDFAWEQDINTTVNQITMFATQHRPDAVLKVNDLTIAIEIKKGKDGSSIRSGIGQSIIYSKNYDFVIFVYVDISEGRNIKNSVTATKEQEVINELWENYNVKFVVV